MTEQYIEGEIANQMILATTKKFVGQNFWARGYYVSTDRKDEEVVRAYIQAQEKEDQRLEQLNLFE